MYILRRHLLCAFLFLLAACQPSAHDDSLWSEKSGELSLKLAASSLRFALRDGKLVPVADVVDMRTFGRLVQDERDIRAIDNPHLNDAFRDFYFRDKSNVYEVVTHGEEPALKRKCAIGAYQLLGGAYLRAGNSVYWKNLEVVDADVASFRTIRVVKNKSEWEVTVGADQKREYWTNRPMMPRIRAQLFMPEVR